MLCLVKGEVTEQWYMNDAKEPKVETRLVEAGSVCDAEAKFKAHFAANSSEYCVYYYTNNIEVHEVIR